MWRGFCLAMRSGFGAAESASGRFPAQAARGGCGGEADAFRDLPRRRRGSERGISLLRDPACERSPVRFPTPRGPRASATIHHVETRTTVLLVDDHPSFRACARAILEADGFEVIGEAEDGEGALQALGSLAPDVVLLDVQLPDMDGFAVLEQLGTGAPPVVLISSRDASDYDGMIRGSGARAFISKAELSGSAIRSLIW